MISSEESIYLSIVVPVYNEEKNVSECVRRAEAFLSLKRCGWELLISSDGSKDGTEKLVEDCIKARSDGRVKLLRFDKNRGKGASVRRAVLDAKGKYVLVTDVDLSAPIKEVDKLIAALEKGAQVACGSRALRAKDCDVQQSFKRQVSGRIFNFFVQSLVLPGIQDSQCGFKCFKREVAFIKEIELAPKVILR